MFDEFYNSVKQKKPTTKVTLDLSQDMLFNPSLFKDKLKNIDSLSDRELFDLIKDSYKSLLSDLFFGNNSYLELFTNSKFLIAFTQVISNVKDLSYDNKIHCNKLAYDYFTSHNPDPYIKQLLYSLSKVINRMEIPALLGLGIPEDLASYMALSRFSSQKDKVNVKRLNLIIINSDPKLMTEQTIVYIYEKLFDRFTPLFESTMFDVYTLEDNFSESMQNIYSIISLSILDILNGLPSETIRRVLISYEGDYKAFHAHLNRKTIRFSMQCLSPDYSRINQVVEALKAEDIFVP